MELSELKKGTTTIGIACKDGTVLASETRATMGNLIAHKHADKIYKLDNNIGMTTAGLVGDDQALARYVRAEVEIHRLKTGSPMSARGAATLTANILQSNRFMPFFVGLIIGGIDSGGSSVYGLDAAGGMTDDKYVSIGSGSPFALGVLEDHFDSGITVSEATDLAIRALHSSMERDSASGGKAVVVNITPKGYVKLEDREIDKRWSKIAKASI
ncbi:MAG: archaeal proteasome endopeptidase complex subunit beta [Thermoplasmata archaeon]|uniref:Proteasome subunit beta n=1 Tax=Candidatus Sysuiplasma superficiale TaxID=2823368 RepID=A0A8J7YJ51_9ARCH|nr:archaeal proteasome endopeptidase complex subunit beta [Candidatus Sysuiplasma superficiale]MBX8643213.1 archaeal proteasome endopeptidase complex subunit beta [Candidatus Sysuiplasma superficiale]MCL4346628.1 archaeal proteasome endopeptidase complex subunit beta [Candidatus Thermoplasmatota archaeon]